MDLSYQLIFIANFLACVFLMKILSWSFTPAHRRPSFWYFFICSPYISVRGLRYKVPPSPSHPLDSFFLYTMLTGIYLLAGKKVMGELSYLDRIILGPSIYLFTEALGALGQLIFFWRKEPVFPIHFHPLSAKSLSEFWGRRWNIWVQDWIADMGRPYHRSHKKKIFMSFLFSGLFHEAMVNLPHWLISGESYFGTMLAYFVIQGLGLFVDKKFLRHGNPHLRRIYCILVVIIPAPLFINVPLLRFFGIN